MLPAPGMRTLLALVVVLAAGVRPAFSLEASQRWCAGAGLGVGATALNVPDSEGGTLSQNPGIGVAVHGGYLLTPRVGLIAGGTLSGFERSHDRSLALIAGPGLLLRASDDVNLELEAGYALAGYEMPTVPSYFHHDSGLGGTLAAQWLPLRLERQRFGISTGLSGAKVSGRTFATALVALAWQYL